MSGEDDRDERLPLLPNTFVSNYDDVSSRKEGIVEENEPESYQQPVAPQPREPTRPHPGPVGDDTRGSAIRRSSGRSSEIEDNLFDSTMEKEKNTDISITSPSKVTPLTILRAYWKTIVLFVTPLLALPLVLVIGDGPSKGAFVIIIMAVYWILEILPLAVTALLPVILYPLLGVQDSDDVCRNYLKDTNFLFVGGLIVAVAVEYWNLHRRLALAVLLLMGSKSRWLMLGFMLTTGFLSMWISNTATTAMMVPIAQSVIIQLLDQNKRNRRYRENRNNANQVVADTPHEKYSVMDETAFNGHVNHAVDAEEQEDTKIKEDQDQTNSNAANLEEDITKVDEIQTTEAENTNPTVDWDSLTDQEKKLCKGLLLCVAYAANIGGTATLTGTGPNVVLSGVVDDLYGTESGVTFASWMLFSLPGTIANLILCWLWLQLLFIGFRSEPEDSRNRVKEEGERSARDVIKEEYKKLGPWTWPEVAVLCHFIVLAFLWLFRNPTFIPGFAGWSGLFPVSDYLTDATAAMIISICLFIFPSRAPWFFRCRVFIDEDDDRPKSREALLTWKIAQKMLPWNIILLLGGGFALADGTEASGLSQWLADQFRVLEFLPPWVFVLIITVIICFFTEFTSNVATATIFLPILAALAESICINPLYIMIPATVACSYAFMLPVATPPNAIAFAYGSLTVPDMMKAGSLMNIIGIIVVNILISSMGIVVFDVFNYPTWAGGYDQCIGTAVPTTQIYATPNSTCIC